MPAKAILALLFLPAALLCIAVANVATLEGDYGVSVLSLGLGWLFLMMGWPWRRV